LCPKIAYHNQREEKGEGEIRVVQVEISREVYQKVSTGKRHSNHPLMRIMPYPVMLSIALFAHRVKTT
jgi:hypothetical protein